jgi:hypothetical protein
LREDLEKEFLVEMTEIALGGDGEQLIAEVLGSVSPEPRIALTRYAQISAELAEEPAARARVLARHDFDDRTWLVEERAWLEHIAAAAASGNDQLAIQYGAAYREAEDALARPEEGAFSLDDYTRLAVATQRAVDPLVILGAAPMTLPQWSRLERRWLDRAERDSETRAELDRLLGLYALTTPDPFDSEDEAPPLSIDDDEADT